jgi:cytochrome c-type biogenesis protein CcmE
MMVVLLIVLGVGTAASLALTAFNKNLMFFFSPSQVKAGEAPINRSFRVGGMVKDNSLIRQEDGLTVQFVVHDNAEEVSIAYKGILPDLFREGQGIVAQGKLNSEGNFIADEVLAKHDENYMPPEVAAAMKPKGIDTPAQGKY